MEKKQPEICVDKNDMLNEEWLKNFKFFVMGEPKPQARPRGYRKGKHIGFYSPSTAWKDLVMKKAHDMSKRKVFSEPVIVRIDYQFKRPNSHYGTGKNAGILKLSAPEFHIKKPDLDNLNKAILDALVDGGLISDDKLVIGLISEKGYTEEIQGALIEIVRAEG